MTDIPDWMHHLDLPDLLKPGEVAVLMRVDPKSVTRWAAAGKLRSTRTLGGHHRFRREDVLEVLARQVEERHDQG